MGGGGALRHRVADGQVSDRRVEHLMGGAPCCDGIGAQPMAGREGG